MENLTYEESKEKLEEILKILEEDNLSLEDHLDYFNQAVKLYKSCSNKLAKAEKELEVIVVENLKENELDMEWYFGYKNWT